MNTIYLYEYINWQKFWNGNDRMCEKIVSSRGCLNVSLGNRCQSTVVSQCHPQVLPRLVADLWLLAHLSGGWERPVPTAGLEPFSGRRTNKSLVTFLEHLYGRSFELYLGSRMGIQEEGRAKVQSALWENIICQNTYSVETHVTPVVQRIETKYIKNTCEEYNGWISLCSYRRTNYRLGFARVQFTESSVDNQTFTLSYVSLYM